MAPFESDVSAPVRAGNTDTVFSPRTTSKPALSSASVTSWRVFSSRMRLRTANHVIDWAASRFASGSADGVTSARRFSGAFGSCSPSLPSTQWSASIDARTVGAVVIRLEPFASQQLRVRDKEIQPSRPLSWCSTHSTLYWSLSSPHQELRSKLAISFLSRWPGGKSCSEKTARRRCIFLHRRGVGISPDFSGFLQNGGAVALAVFSSAAIIHWTGTTAAPSWMKLNDHRQPLSSTARRSRSSPASMATSEG